MTTPQNVESGTLLDCGGGGCASGGGPEIMLSSIPDEYIDDDNQEQFNFRDEEDPYHQSHIPLFHIPPVTYQDLISHPTRYLSLTLDQLQQVTSEQPPQKLTLKYLLSKPVKDQETAKQLKNQLAGFMTMDDYMRIRDKQRKLEEIYQASQDIIYEEEDSPEKLSSSQNSFKAAV